MLRILQSLVCRTSQIKIPARGFKDWYPNYLKEMKKRAKEEGPLPLRQRSAWITWNYPAELFAFCKRLNENISDKTLRTALTHKSYINQESMQTSEISADETTEAEIETNEDLLESGEKFIDSFVKKYLQNTCPALPEDGILALCNYVTNKEILAYIAKNIGLPDIILAKDFPAEIETLASSFKAIVGAILKDQGVKKAEIFLLDFLLPQLIGKDIQDIWEIPYPMETLKEVLSKQGKSSPEARLLRETGRNTMFSTFLVGIYVDKVLIGQGPGETISVAEEMAAVNALQKIFQSAENKEPFPFGLQGQKLIESFHASDTQFKEKRKL